MALEQSDAQERAEQAEASFLAEVAWQRERYQFVGRVKASLRGDLGISVKKLTPLSKEFVACTVTDVPDPDCCWTLM